MTNDERKLVESYESFLRAHPDTLPNSGDAGKLCAIIRRQEAELARLTAGNFTEQEFQGLCHKLSENESAERFCAGCEAYQTRLFGYSPITQLRDRLSDLEISAMPIKGEKP